MAWHQGLKNPVPNFQQSLAVTSNNDPKEARKRGRGPAPPVTWGSLKKLSTQAGALVDAAGADRTPENFLAAVITQLNINSCFIICLILFSTIPCVSPSPSPSPSLHERLQYNLWIRLANIVNASSFCLAQSPDMHGLLGTCLIPVCKAPGRINNATGLANLFSDSQVKYVHMPTWGPARMHLPPDALHLFTPYVANAENNTCARIVGCKGKARTCLNPGPAKWNCSSVENVSFNYAHIILPRGWFCTCGQRTFNYIPANLSLALCCLSRLVPVLPTKEQVQEGARSERSTTALSPQCDGNVTLMSPAEYISLAASLVGLPGLGVGNAKTIGKIACLLAKTINTTSTAIGLLAQEQGELRQAILDNRAAIDFLLLQQHLGCETIKEMCCFNLSDNSQRIQSQLAILRDYAQSIRQEISPAWWSALWSWFPSDLFRQVFQYVVAAVALLIAFCCLAQCIPGLLAWCVPRCRPGPRGPTPRQVYFKYSQLKYKEEEM